MAHVPWVQLVFLVLLSLYNSFVVHTACAYIYIFILPPISSTLCQPSTAEILTHFVEQQCVQGSPYGPLPFCSGDLLDLFWHLLTAGSDFVGAFFVFFEKFSKFTLGQYGIL